MSAPTLMSPDDLAWLRNEANVHDAWPILKRAADHIEAQAARVAELEDARWPTPSSRDGDSRRAPTNPNGEAWRKKVERGAVNAAGMLSDDLSSSAAAWATPNARDWKGQDIPGRAGSPSLPDQVMRLHGDGSSPSDPTSRLRWPTPSVMDSAGFHGKPDKGRTSPNSGQTLAGATEGAARKMRLNPRFVEWLMGLPPGWTDFAPLATESSRNRPSAPSASSGAESMETNR